LAASALAAGGGASTPSARSRCRLGAAVSASRRALGWNGFGLRLDRGYGGRERPGAGGERGEDRVIGGGDPGGRRPDAGGAGQLGDLADLLRGRHRDDGAAVAGARGAPGTVQVCLVVGRWVG